MSKFRFRTGVAGSGAELGEERSRQQLFCPHEHFVQAEGVSLSAGRAAKTTCDQASKKLNRRAQAAFGRIGFEI
ncbi:MAG: hypothetical protein HY735_38400 [Verrucomicrobia bacterium]|nr:hypothetical protein [Verrucomicrobiota bacterium]